MESTAYLPKSGSSYSVPTEVWNKLPDKDKQAVVDYNRKFPKTHNNKFKERNQRKQGPTKKTPLGIHKALHSAKAGDMFVKGNDGKLQTLQAGEQGIPGP